MEDCLLTSETHAQSSTGGSERGGAQPRAGGALRLALFSGVWFIPLSRLHHLAGYATLTGEPEDYFLGWLEMRGKPVPVFDLNRVVCDQPTPENFGSRILVIEAAAESPTPYIGLLAGGVTDTIGASEAASGAVVEALDIDTYLPMLYTLIPPLPTGLSSS
jgi:chemotaxis signal transduction protein